MYSYYEALLSLEMCKHLPDILETLFIGQAESLLEPLRLKMC